MSRGDRTYREYMKSLKKIKLLILDEWLLYPLKENEAWDVLDLVEARFHLLFSTLGSMCPAAMHHPARSACSRRPAYAEIKTNTSLAVFIDDQEIIPLLKGGSI